MSTRRITVEEVLEAYRVTGVKPHQGAMFVEQVNCGCAQGVLLIASGTPKDKAINDVCYDWTEEQFGLPYAGNFRNGFDGFDCHTGENWRKVFYEREWGAEERERAILGFADGQAVAAAVFQKQGAQA